MAKGILGRKLGMTQIFDAAGNLIPVTIIDATPNIVLQQKTVENVTVRPLSGGGASFIIKKRRRPAGPPEGKRGEGL